MFKVPANEVIIPNVIINEIIIFFIYTPFIMYDRLCKIDYKQKFQSLFVAKKNP